MFNLAPRSSLEILTSPQLSSRKAEIEKALAGEDLRDHIVILSSGTTSTDLKGYALSREALIANANAVNNHFSLTSQDVWGLSLPSYHVGGLSVLVRAALLKNRLVEFGKWNPVTWTQTLEKEKITITTVVPTQVYDLVKNTLPAPSALRYLIVGGDFLSEELEKRARDLGWPVIRTFGMTEVCSQLASGKFPGDALHLLPIHEAKVIDERLAIKSQALFTLQFSLGEKPKITYARELCDDDGHYLTQDRASLSGTTVHPLGRLDDQIKVSGRLVSLLSLKNTLSKFALDHNLYGKVELDLVHDERKGNLLRLLFLREAAIRLKEIEEIFHPLKLDVTTEVESFERTDLGKLKRGQKR